MLAKKPELVFENLIEDFTSNPKVSKYNIKKLKHIRQVACLEFVPLDHNIQMLPF